MRDPEDNKAILDAMLAVDGAIQTLVMARVMLEDRYTAVEAPEEPVVDDMGDCTHANVIEVLALTGDPQRLCKDCGANLADS